MQALQFIESENHVVSLTWQITKSIGQVSEEMGNSPRMIKRHYHDAREEGEALEYFEIHRGEQPGNLVRIEREGAGTDWNKKDVPIVPQPDLVERTA